MHIIVAIGAYTYIYQKDDHTTASLDEDPGVFVEEDLMFLSDFWKSL